MFYCNQEPSRSKIQSKVQTHSKLNNNYTYSLYLKTYSATNGLYCIQKLSVCRSCRIATRWRWAKIGCDILMLDNQDYVITVDYMSNFWEIDKLQTSTSHNVVRKLKSAFRMLWDAGHPCIR